jgi:hypothetical protein
VVAVFDPKTGDVKHNDPEVVAKVR